MSRSITYLRNRPTHSPLDFAHNRTAYSLQIQGRLQNINDCPLASDQHLSPPPPTLYLFRVCIFQRIPLAADPHSNIGLPSKSKATFNRLFLRIPIPQPFSSGFYLSRESTLFCRSPPSAVGSGSKQNITKLKLIHL